MISPLPPVFFGLKARAGWLGTGRGKPKPEPSSLTPSGHSAQKFTDPSQIPGESRKVVFKSFLLIGGKAKPVLFFFLSVSGAVWMLLISGKNPTELVTRAGGGLP